MHFAELLEFALRLERLRENIGLDQVISELRGDKRHQRWMHSRQQLELGTLLAATGVNPSFETPLPGGHQGQGSADVTFTVDGVAQVVSSYVLYPTDVFRSASASSDRVFEQLTRLHLDAAVNVEARITSDLAEEDETCFIATVEAAIKAVAADGYARHLETDFAVVDLSAAASVSAADFNITAAMPKEDLWPRVARRLEKKAQALRCDAPVWVRADLLDGLWQLTPWAMASLEERLIAIEEALALNFSESDVAGFVLSSGALLAPGTVDTAEVRTGSGAVAMRYPIRPLRGREILLVPFRNDEALNVFVAAYRGESAWLNDALASVHLPSLDDLFG